MAGHSLTLTIDEVIQYIAEKELDEAVNRSNAKSGTIIITNPKTGAILAMAGSPRFDPNAVAALNPDRWRNRALTDSYEPGSTMKVVLAAAALEEKVMTPSSMIFGENGQMAVANTVIHDHEKSGWMSFAQMVQRSSNIGAAKVGMALGDWRLFDYLKEFGFGEKSNIDLPGEVAGLLRGPREWGRRSGASISMGQEIAVTPLQMVNAVSAIANGGILMKPFIVSEVRNIKGLAVAANDATAPASCDFGGNRADADRHPGGSRDERDRRKGRDSRLSGCGKNRDCTKGRSSDRSVFFHISGRVISGVCPGGRSPSWR